MWLLLQLVDLSIHRSAADEQQRTDRPAGTLREIAALALNLNGQFVRRRHDHGLRRRLFGIEPAENREQIGERLASTGFGVQIGIFARQQYRQRRDLNRRGFTDLLLGKGHDEIGMYIKFGEGHG